MSHENPELMHEQVQPTAQPEPPPPPAEALDMTETLRLLEKISRMPDIRFEKVQQMRDLIARGELETEERLDITVRRLMEDLGL